MKIAVAMWASWVPKNLFDRLPMTSVLCCSKLEGQAEPGQQGPPSEAPAAEEDARPVTLERPAQLSGPSDHPDLHLASAQPQPDAPGLEQRPGFAQASAGTQQQQQPQQHFGNTNNAFQRSAAEAAPQQFTNPPV